MSGKKLNKPVIPVHVLVVICTTSGCFMQRGVSRGSRAGTCSDKQPQRWMGAAGYLKYPYWITTLLHTEQNQTNTGFLPCPVPQEYQLDQGMREIHQAVLRYARDPKLVVQYVQVHVFLGGERCSVSLSVWEWLEDRQRVTRRREGRAYSGENGLRGDWYHPGFRPKSGSNVVLMRGSSSGG